MSTDDRPFVSLFGDRPLPAEPHELWKRDAAHPPVDIRRAMLRTRAYILGRDRVHLVPPPEAPVGE